ncbi:unnamed protein product [Porites lobata]|uniref:UspA domain-containing protein n=1 Tax=Porites lobata TaxID=104759 RepID=A0ABN8R8U0_9CNID|nr:unnamed protein product [Porites lobata]
MLKTVTIDFLSTLTDISDIQEADFKNLMEAAKEQAKVMLEKFEVKCKKNKIPVKTRIELGSPGEVICKVAKEENVTCILLGNRGLGAFRRTILGSVSDHVVHHSRCPVIIVPPRRYADRFRQAEDQVVFVHVYEAAITPPPTFAHTTSLPSREEWELMHLKAERKAKEMLAKYEKKCIAKKLPYKTIYAHGPIGDVICAAGNKVNAEYIVLGNRGLGTIRRTILGSVCDYVTKHMNVPVLMVPTTAENNNSR